MKKTISGIILPDKKFHPLYLAVALFTHSLCPDCYKKHYNVSSHTARLIQPVWAYITLESYCRRYGDSL